MTRLNVYHGGDTVSRHEGYKASNKPNRSMLGTGLYCTVRHYVAERYTSGSKAMNGLVLDVDPARNAAVINITFEDAQAMISTLPLRNQKEWQKLTEQRIARGVNSITLETVEVFVVNYTTSPHKHMQNLNDFFLEHKAQFSLDSGIIRLHDFSCIQSIERNPPVTFEGSEIELTKLRTIQCQNA